MEQKFILENIKSFELEDIFECGQCFRWNKQEDGSYVGVIGQSVLSVKKEGNIITICGKSNQNLKELCTKYFDLETDYEEMKKVLSRKDKFVKESIKDGNGIRILNQDLWETIISFIISANNNIPRIKGIIEKMSQKYGKEIEWNGKKYYTFPSFNELEIASVEDLKKLGLGFRDKRIFETTKMFLENKITIKELEEENDICILKEKLMTLPGVGPKVADCIMLFGLHRFEVFPIDVWIRRVMNELYFKQEDESKVNKKQIENLAKEKYGNLAGIAQQYLFYSRRKQ